MRVVDQQTVRGAGKGERPEALGQTLPAPTASFGIAVYPVGGTTPADLLKAADQALYRAKKEGRDQVCTTANSALPR